MMKRWLYVVSVVGGFISASSAVAGPPSQESASLEQGIYLMRTGRVREAAGVAAAVLKSAPDSLEAQKLYIQARKLGLRESAAIDNQYRTWLEEEPSDSLRRVCLAYALSLNPADVEDPCDEVLQALTPLPEEPRLRLEAASIQEGLAEACWPDKQAELERQFLESAKAVPEGELLLLEHTLRNGPIEQTLADSWRGRWDQASSILALAPLLFQDNLAGPGLEAARTDVLAAARRHRQSNQPLFLDAAYEIFQAAGLKSDSRAAREALLKFDPGWSRGTADPLLAEIMEAATTHQGARALDALEALEPHVESSGAVRSAFEASKAMVFEQLDQQEKAMAAYRLALKADPSNHRVANALAWTLATRGENLEEALSVMDVALRHLTAERYDPSTDELGQGPDGWRQARSATMANYLDTRAFVLYRLNRLEEAAENQRDALLLGSDPGLDARMGLILARLGQVQEAGDYLVRGLSGGALQDESIDLEARETLERIFPQLPYWHPDGANGYIETCRAMGGTDYLAGYGEEEPPLGIAGWEGQVLPDLTFSVSGNARNLSDYPGYRIVDFWATWCEPCLEALDQYQKMLRQYKGRQLTILAISVDDAKEDLEAFWKTHKQPSYVVAWGGTDVAAMIGLEVVPSMMLLAPDGTVIYTEGGVVDPKGPLTDLLESVLPSSDRRRRD